MCQKDIFWRTVRGWGRRTLVTAVAVLLLGPHLAVDEPEGVYVALRIRMIRISQLFG